MPKTTVEGGRTSFASDLRRNMVQYMFSPLIRHGERISLPYRVWLHIRFYAQICLAISR